MPAPALVPDELRSRPFRGSDALRAGLLTPRRLAPGRFTRDRERLNRLHVAGRTVVFVTAADLRDRTRLIAHIAAALA